MDRSATYENERDRLGRVASEKSRLGRDIAPIPAVVDPVRKVECSRSFRRFCEIYLTQSFGLAWSDDHLRVIGKIERAVLEGMLFAVAMPRGSGKTTLTEAGAMWAFLTGARKFIVIIGSDKRHADDMLESIKSELIANDLLMSDFPEAIHALRKLEGIAQRSGGQLCNGEATGVLWTADTIVLPTIAGSRSSGAILQTVGLTGGIRGLKFKRPDGENARPDLVIIDDPQTDESAASPGQCDRRVRLLCGAVLGLAGPGKRIAGVMPCTVIHPGDMADQILDRQKHPEWQGERTKLIYQFPAADGLWEQYKKIRSDGMRAGDNGTAGTEFYACHRSEMDAGAAVAWEQRFQPGELSALQHAMNLRIDLGDRAFFAEYQNDPLPETGQASDALTVEQILGKINNRKRGTVPNEAAKIVCFVDVMKTALFWAVAAFEDDFTGYVLDYGCFPDQHRDHFSLRDLKRTLAGVLKTDGLEPTIYAGLTALATQLLNRKWMRDDGAEMSVERCLIDANWGESTDVIYQFCRESPHTAVLIPTHGTAIAASGRSFNEYVRKKGDEVGDHWRRPARKGPRVVRYGLFDSNYWKSFLHERLAVPMGGRGCLSLFGREGREHQLLAEHLTAEEPVPVTAKGRTVTEWKIKPLRPDNHWLDCLSGCCVAASTLRISLAERKQEQAKTVRKVSFGEMQREKARRQ